MDDIEEYQRRITAALDRIARKLETLPKVEDRPQATPDTSQSSKDTENLQDALAEEKMANAQLEERVKSLRAQLERSAAPKTPTPDPSPLEALKDMDAQLQSLKKANADLRSNNEALRDANAKGLGDADIINESLKVELEALKAVQAATDQELGTVINTIDSLKEQGGA